MKQFLLGFALGLCLTATAMEKNTWRDATQKWCEIAEDWHKNAYDAAAACKINITTKHKPFNCKF